VTAALAPLPRRAPPVTDPLRVLVVDPAAPARAALCRAIDMEPELAVLCSSWDARRAAADAARCGADVIVVALNPDDPRCAALAAALEAAGNRPGGADRRRLGAQWRPGRRPPITGRSSPRS